MLWPAKSTADQKVGESGQEGQAVGIFMKTTIANLGIAKDLLDSAEWVFHLGPDAGFVGFGKVAFRVKGFALTGTQGDVPCYAFPVLVF